MKLYQIFLFLGIVSSLCNFSQGWLFWRKKKKANNFSKDEVSFYLYTRTNAVGTKIRLSTVLSAASAGFSANRNTKFITHGWKSDAHKPWVKSMTKALLRKEDLNVFAVDWSEGASTSNYNDAIKNTRVTGQAIADFVNALQGRYSLSRSKVHLIGHSMGGHCSAEAGKRLQNPKIARISGLDVPDVGVNVLKDDETLDSSDANFVDETHTHVSWTTKGHADFFPNGGLQMPGCSKLAEKILEGLKLLTGNGSGFLSMLRCDHDKAIYYYTESINSNCRFTARACSSWDDYKDGDCSNGSINYLGYHATKPSTMTKYYLRTNSNSPYCKN